MLVLILAAGKGTRMRSAIPKVLHEVAGQPMIEYPLSIAQALNPIKIVTVVGYGADDVIKVLDGRAEHVIQNEQNGTAHAVLAAYDILSAHQDEHVLIMPGDMPCLNISTIEAFIKDCTNNAPNFMTTKSSNPAGYGRVIRTVDNTILRIVEEKDASDNVKKISEINTGVYLCKISTLLDRLNNVDNQNAQKEYYLTDIIGKGSTGWLAKDETEFLGINDCMQLANASKMLWSKRTDALMAKGVTFYDPKTAYIGKDVDIEGDVIIFPNVYIEGKTTIGAGSVIYPGVRITDSEIGTKCTIKDNTLIEESSVGADTTIGPMAHLRPGNTLQGNNRIGNFVELKKVTLGVGTKANHLTYLGDATIGKDVNVGCGVITCNYDGFAKHQTIIGDNVFVGSDVQLVAPISVGDGAIIGAGATITKDVPQDAVAVARAEQVNHNGKANKFREMKRSNHE